jgi:hypothetical protein
MSSWSFNRASSNVKWRPRARNAQSRKAPPERAKTVPITHAREGAKVETGVKGDLARMASTREESGLGMVDDKIHAVSAKASTTKAHCRVRVSKAAVSCMRNDTP